PSVFSHQILNAMPYAFLDDAPLEERRARAVILRRALPDQSSDLGNLNPEAIQSAAEDAWPAARDREELHDALLGLILFPETEKSRFPAEAEQWFESLVEDGRAARRFSNDRVYWVAAERAESIDVCRVVRGWVEVSGPLTPSGLARILGLDAGDVRSALAQLEGEGLVLRGQFTPQREEEEFCDRRILARIHRATIAHLRREIEPVQASVLLRFLFSWQHLAAGSQLSGDHGILEAVEQLQGFEAAAAAWEDEILRARIRDYDPALLDNLCLAGEVVWGRWTRRATQAEVPARRPGLTRSATLGLGIREDMQWLLDPAPPDEEALSVPARNILAFLRKRGASFFAEIKAGAGHLPSEVEEALWQLVAAGLVTADAFGALRSLVNGDARRSERSPRRRREPRLTREGRWSLLEPLGPVPENLVELRARQFLRRYGVLLRELTAREPSAPPWRELLWVLRRAEARGEIRGGRFVAGYPGEQFALPEAVDALRAIRRDDSQGHFLRISACDPLNLVGILTPGPRVAAVLGNRVIYRDGIPVAAIESGETRIISHVEADERPVLERLLDERPPSAFDPSRSARPKSLRNRL
ncbi:MAG TPA: hypothetical protein VGJ22_06930, partial [Anaerolineales bacterium]